jgi:hypothetical protein
MGMGKEIIRKKEVTTRWKDYTQRLVENVITGSVLVKAY